MHYSFKQLFQFIFKQLPIFLNLMLNSSIFSANYLVFLSLLYHQFYNVEERTYQWLDWRMVFSEDTTEHYTRIIKRLKEMELTPSVRTAFVQIQYPIMQLYNVYNLVCLECANNWCLVF